MIQSLKTKVLLVFWNSRKRRGTDLNLGALVAHLVECAPHLLRLSPSIVSLPTTTHTQLMSVNKKKQVKATQSL